MPDLFYAMFRLQYDLKFELPNRNETSYDRCQADIYQEIMYGLMRNDLTGFFIDFIADGFYTTHFNTTNPKLNSVSHKTKHHHVAQAFTPITISSRHPNPFTIQITF
jgi:hypothetical protein